MEQKESSYNPFEMLGLAFIALPEIAIHGYLLSVLWEWFVVPVGLKTISVPQAAGIILITIPFQNDLRKHLKLRDIFESSLARLSVLIFCLAVGWFFHSHMIKL